ncbi:hypothetical protein OROMI_009734 [Orobanche minor]
MAKEILHTHTRLTIRRGAAVNIRTATATSSAYSGVAAIYRSGGGQAAGAAANKCSDCGGSTAARGRASISGQDFND